MARALNDTYEFYIKSNLSRYENEWVAMAKDRVIAHGKHADKVYKEAKKKEPKSEISLAKVPKNQPLII